MLCFDNIRAPLKSVSNYFLNVLAAVYVLAYHLISVETFVNIAMSVGAVSFYYFYRDPDGKALNQNLNWSFISFAIVFPIT